MKQITIHMPESRALFSAPAIVASDSIAKQQLIDMAASNGLGTPKMRDEAVETIEVKGIPDRRAPTKIDVDADDLEIGVSIDGTMDFLVDDGLTDVRLKLSAAAVNKLGRCLGISQGIA